MREFEIAWLSFILTVHIFTMGLERALKDKSKYRIARWDTQEKIRTRGGEQR